MRGGAWWQDDDYVASHYEPDAELEAADARRAQARIDAANVERNRVAAEKAAAREAAGLIRWTAGRAGDDRFREDMTVAELETMGDCPGCKKPMTECRGHSKFGDPQGWRDLQAARREHVHEWLEDASTTRLKHGAPMVRCACGETGWRLPLLTD